MDPFLTIQHSSGSCPVYLTDRFAQAIPPARESLALNDRRALLTSESLMALYAKELGDLVREVGVGEVGLAGKPLLMPDGEEHKNMKQAERLWEELTAQGLSRHSALISFGGGVVTDMGGFLAACYMRGIPSLYIPTTLLAQVDASLGGKTGVNLRSGKNLIGVFHQPSAVILCLDLLHSLPAAELSNGYAEIIKVALLADREFFAQLEDFFVAAKEEPHLSDSQLTLIIKRSCRIKAEVIQQDERERLTGAPRRALLNLGHTFAHALEAQRDYKGIRHGEAVSLGICLAAAISHNLGHIGQEDYSRIVKLLAAAGLPHKLPAGFQAADLIRFIQKDKKKQSAAVPLVLLKSIGEAYISEPYPVSRIIELTDGAAPLVR